MREQLYSLIDEMLDGQILLTEAVCEFEKVFIEEALRRHDNHLSRTAAAIGIHRNTLTKRVTEYEALRKKKSRAAVRALR